VIGPDAGGLLGAVLVDYINFSVREQMAIPDPAQRARVVIVVDEFQSIPGVDYPGLLAELQKMGASFILATQALGQLDAIDKKLRPAIMSNVETLFVFQTSADDADILRHELDDEVTATDIVNLSDHSCYIKTQSGSDRLPVMHVETLAPKNGDSLVAEQIVAQMVRYTRPSKIVEAEREAIKQQWFGRELSALKQKMETQNQTSSQGQNQTNRSAGATQTDRVHAQNQSGHVSTKHPQPPSGNLQIPIEDDGETRSKAKKPYPPQPAHPGLAAMRAHSQPQDTLGTPTTQAQAARPSEQAVRLSQQPARPSEQSAVVSVPSEKSVEANKPVHERAGLDADGKENGTEHVVEQDTVQVKVTLVETTPSLPPEDDSAKPKSDAKRINP